MWKFLVDIIVNLFVKKSVRAEVKYNLNRLFNKLKVRNTALSPDKNKKYLHSFTAKRIFITTGLISLINALCIIEDIVNKDYEDTLVIISFNSSEKFVETQKKIASLHKFQKIIFLKNEQDIIKFLDKNNYNEIYTTTFLKILYKTRKYKNISIIDEGPGYGIFDLKNFKNVKSYCVTNFLNKFSFARSSNNVPYKYINSDVFKTISKNILDIFNEKQYIKTKRNLLFVGHYIYRKLGEDFAISYYKKYIDYFINLGYNVYFKPHPRDNDTILPILKQYYTNNKQFHTMDTKLPIEIYNYNFDLIVGSYSGVLISLPHYWNIPAINLPMKELYNARIGITFKKYFALYDYYCPSFEEMKDCLNKPKQDIYKKYKQIIDKKFTIEKNIKLKKILLYNKYSIKNLLFLRKNFKPY